MQRAEQAIGKVLDSKYQKTLEWFGVATAIAYSLLIALNLGYEVLSFSLLFVSALAIGKWTVVCKHYGILFPSVFLHVCWYHWSG